MMEFLLKPKNANSHWMRQADESAAALVWPRVTDPGFCLWVHLCDKRAAYCTLESGAVHSMLLLCICLSWHGSAVYLCIWPMLHRPRLLLQVCLNAGGAADHVHAVHDRGLRIALDVARGLAFLHRRRIAHLDLVRGLSCSAHQR